MTSAFAIYIPDLSGSIREPELVECIKAAPDKTDLSFLAELWNSGDDGKALALHIADLSAPRIERTKL